MSGGRKRPSDARAPPTKRKSFGKAQAEDDLIQPDLSEALTEALNQFDELWAQHEDCVEILESEFKDLDAKQRWARKLNDWFPPNPDKADSYLRPDWNNDNGLVWLRPYHWAWDRHAGNKGTVTKESFRVLMKIELFGTWLPDGCHGSWDRDPGGVPAPLGAQRRRGTDPGGP